MAAHLCILLVPIQRSMMTVSLSHFDKPGHVTPLTAVWPFHHLSKLFLVHKIFCWAAPCFRLSGGHWPSLPIILAFVFKGIPQPGNLTKIKLIYSFFSDHLSNPEVDRTRRHIMVSSSEQPHHSERSWRGTEKRSWGMGGINYVMERNKCTVNEKNQ